METKNALGSTFLHFRATFAKEAPKHKTMFHSTIKFQLQFGVTISLLAPSLDTVDWIKMLFVDHPFKTIKKHLQSILIRAILWKI